MIQKNRLQRFTYKTGKILDPIVGFCIVGFSLIMSVESEAYQDWPAIFVRVIGSFQKHSFPAWMGLGFLTILGWYFRRGGDPWIWDKLQTLLDEFQAVAYRRFKDHVKDDHRVTLFKYRRLSWVWNTPMTKGNWPWKRGRLPWSGWLVPVLRSGITSKKTKAIFLVPDNGNQAEGVAGRAWASNSIIVSDRLPPLTAQSSEMQINRYATRTYCPSEIVRDYVKQNRPLPRSIGAIPIEVGNRPWGVLVLDSRDENGVTDELLNNFTLIVKSISQLLEKAK